jgi:V/A-type H+-transporting ATPase subunit I
LVGNYDEISSRLNKEIGQRKVKLKNLENDKEKLAEAFGPKINTLKKQIEVELRVLSELGKITHSELFTFMKGWVPDKYVKKVKNLDDAIVIIEDAGEDAPTKLDNPWFFKPFENFMYIFALPRYGEFDPTALISIFFPLFYGVMLSDAGYGVLLLLVSLATRRKFRVMSELLLISAISTIFFGVIFDSYFGISLGKGLIDPLKRPFDLLYYSLVFGVFYVDLGLIMGMIQNLLNDNYYEALTQQVSLFIFQFGLAFLTFHLQSGLVMVVVGLGLKLWADNIRGFFAFTGLLSSIISFSRLASLALATTWVSFTVNFLAGLVANIHGLALIPAILLIIGGHLANFGFNAFGAFIHALRLHYVEFMGLFFTAKGKPFTPLGE